MEAEEILKELTDSERDGSLQIFRKLITCEWNPRSREEEEIPADRATWQPVLTKLLEILSKNRNYGKEQILLIPHAFLVLLHKQYEIDEFRSILQSYLQLDTNVLHSFNTDYNIQDINLFKLLIIHGYLQVNKREIYVGGICELPFQVLYQNCIQYTKYTHLAYKILHTWLQRTSKTDFWDNCDPCLERKLETIIYSNWDNSIKEVSKQNSTSIFNQYLRIMNRKYKGFLLFVFQDSISNISWLNETKYVILTEICNVWDNIQAITDREFIVSIFTSLTKNYLRTSGTKLYSAISNKLGNEQWKDAFGDPIRYYILQWGSGPQMNYQALHLLCTQWLEPTMKKHRSILPFLWELSTSISDNLFRSHLERIASETGVSLHGGNVHILIDHSDEYLRLNSFAAHCQKHICLRNDELENHFSIVKHFLFYNVNSSSTFLRRGMIKYFRIFFLNLLKFCNTQQYYNKQVFHVFQWLHEFLLDCFEIGSCYQRRVLGIKLYEIILFYTNEREMNSGVRNDSRYREDLNNGFKIKEELKDFGEWMLTNRTSLFCLFKLILDPGTDIREASAAIILEHFQESSLTDSEKKVLLDTAITKCNSSKFYETESGSTLMKILSKWLPFREVIVIKETEFLSKEYKSSTMHTTYIEYLLHEAHNQLVQIKQDILRAAMQSSPFHGILTAILNVGFRNELKTEFITVEYTETLLTLLENAVNFLLSLLSSKSSNCEFSSSFAEMGLAIDKTVKDSEITDEYDDVVLSPAHQVVITCIWISLKVSCELASEIGMLMYSYEIVQRSTNLITSVLMKCRHKGAIEAAGVAIGHLTKKLVSVESYSKLPEDWLNSLTSGDKITPNLTRRSAGLSIMFHRIVANDNRHGKPLVHIAIRNLLDLLVNTPETGTFGEPSLTEGQNESYQDLPRAKHLHFLQRLVADSDLHAQVVPYLERITMECFKNLQSQMWTVRNASLQLFGAIVPRIAGQLNGGQTLDFGNGYSVDHFITHYPELANHIFLELEGAASWENGSDATLKSHSAIVPSVILLSRMSTGGSDFVDYSSRTYIRNVKQILKLLFGSPIGNVRILAAKAYAALVPFPQINSEYEKLKRDVQNIENPNYAHGYMCAIKYLGEKFQTESEIPYYNRKSQAAQSNESINSGDSQLAKRISSVSKIEKFWNDLYSSKVEWNLCYVVEAMSLMVFQDPRTFPDIFLFKEIGQEVDAVLNTEGSKPGFGEFVETLSRLYADNVNRSDNIDKGIARRILNSQCIDQSVTLLNNLKYDIPVHDIVLDHILRRFNDCDEALLDAMVGYLSKSIQKPQGTWDKVPSTLFPQSLANLDAIKIKVCQLMQVIEKDRRYWKLELFCYILINIFDFDSKSMNAMVDYCCAKVLDDDEVVRRSAAECLPCLLLRFTNTENNNKLRILRLCLALLKDEVSQIRELARLSLVDFFETDFGDQAASPLDEILYYKIFEEILIVSNDRATFTTIEIVQFFSDFAASINCTKDSEAMVESPFDHEDEATSAEETKLLNVIFCSILRLGRIEVLENDLHLGDNILIDSSNAVEARNKIQAKISIDFSDLKTILDLSYNDYMVAKRDIVIELCNLILESAKR